MENSCSFLRYSVFCILNHSINFKRCDTMASISTWGRVLFWIYILHHKPSGNETSQLINRVMGHTFRKNFALLGGLSPEPTYSSRSKNNHELVVFCYFEGVHWDDYFKARNFCGIKIWRFREWDPKSAKFKCCQ